MEEALRQAPASMCLPNPEHLARRANRKRAAVRPRNPDNINFLVSTDNIPDNFLRGDVSAPTTSQTTSCEAMCPLAIEDTCCSPRTGCWSFWHEPNIGTILFLLRHIACAPLKEYVFEGLIKISAAVCIVSNIRNSAVCSPIDNVLRNVKDVVTPYTHISEASRYILYTIILTFDGICTIS